MTIHTWELAAGEPLGPLVLQIHARRNVVELLAVRIHVGAAAPAQIVHVLQHVQLGDHPETAPLRTTPPHNQSSLFGLVSVYCVYFLSRACAPAIKC